MSTPWPCPSCGANCKTPESYGIHVKRCRVMSVEEIGELISESEVSWQGQKPIDSERHARWSKYHAGILHAVMVANLRGKR